MLTWSHILFFTVIEFYSYIWWCLSAQSTDTHIVSAAGRSLQLMSLIFSSLKISSSVKYQYIFSSKVKQSCWWDRWLWNSRGRGSSSWGSHPFPCAKKSCLIILLNMFQALAHLALKGNERWYSDWFDLCSAQNTPINNLRHVPHSVPKLSTIEPAKLTWSHPKYTSTLHFRPCTVDCLNRALSVAYFKYHCCSSDGGSQLRN